MSCAHADKVEEYIENSKWNRPESPFVIHTIALPETSSVGDVMRDLDSKHLIRSDFLLIGGDVVCNIDFSKVLKAHNERKSKDKNAIMTVILREASALHRTRPRLNPGLFVLDEETNRCLRYEVVKPQVSRMTIDGELLSEHENISFRNDLIDCQIDICTQDIPALFSENFDYDNMRSDFVRGILTSDLLGKTIYAHILDQGYAARVQSIQTYDAISKDVISRYSYPITPDNNFLEDQTYSYQKGHIYKEDGVVLAQSCNIGSCTVIGSKTFIGDGTEVKQTVVGRRCKIGKNVKVEGSYIWDDVIIEDGVSITNSIIANRVIINSNSVIEKGVIISNGCIVGEGRTIRSNIRLTTSIRREAYEDDDEDEENDGDDEDDEVDEEDESEDYKEEKLASKNKDRNIFDSGDSTTEIVGVDGEGFVFHESDLSNDDDEDSLDHTVDGMVYDMEQLEISDSSIESFRLGEKKRKKHHRTLSTTTATSEDNDEEETFFKEAIASIDRSIRENHSADIAVLELNTLRMTMNAPYEEVRRAVIHAFVIHISRLVKTATLDMKAATTNLFKDWKRLLTRIIFEDKDKVDLLIYLQRESARQLSGDKLLFYAADTLYEDDIIDEQNAFDWWESPESTETEEMKNVRKLTSQWIDWLKNAEEEEESEDGSD